MAGRRRATFTLGLALVALLAVGASGEPEATARLSDVTVTDQREAVIVRLKTSRPPKYWAEILDSPHRLVVDLSDTIYEWRTTPLVVGTDPIKQVRGSQYRDGVARVVVQLMHRAEYAIREDPEGLTIVIPKAAAGAPLGSATAGSSARADDREHPPLRKVEQSKPSKAVKVDLKDVELPVFIRLVSEVTGKNFLFDEKITGKVTVITPKEVSLDRLYQLFLAVLQFKGYAAVPSGNNLIEIIPLSEAKQNWTEVLSEERGQGFITRLISLNHLNANEGIRILTPLVSRNGVINADLQTNTIILTDSARNVERLVSVLSALDKESPRGKGEIHVYPLATAEAEEVAKNLTALFAKLPPGQGGQPPGLRVTLSGPVNVTADKTRNSLIIVAAPQDYAAMKEVIGQLDVKRRQEGKINVYALENAEAEDLAKTLATLFSRQLPAQPGQPPGSSVPLTGPLAGPLAGPVNVTADKPRNSLIITAAPEDYDVVRDVIRQLDIRRRQVYVEAAIIEISQTKLKQLGFEFQAALPTGGSVQPLGGTNFGGIGQAATGPAGLAGLTGLAAGVVKGFFTFNGTQFLNVLALVRALQSEDDVNVLSTPHLLTTDNQKAEIVVGENVPFISAQSQTTGGNILTSIERKDVGITLRLTPRVSEGEFVKLDIYQEISSLTQDPAFDTNRVGPVITKRYATTTVVAKDGQTIAIGGLIKDNVDRTRSKVPILGDIPLLGRLFQYYKRQADKTNLLIFITPTIVKDDTLSDITQRKRQELLEKSRPETDETKNDDGSR
jgi:general secretion pathway protein D